MIFVILAQAGAIALLWWLFEEARGGIDFAYREMGRLELRLCVSEEQLRGARREILCLSDTDPGVPPP